jgi:cytochrome c oxidase subunit I
MSPSTASSQPAITYLNHETTLRSWLLTRDHKRIGVMFLALVILSLLLGGIFAMIIRIELLTPGPTLIEPMTYNRMFTLHGVTMVWLFMIPAIPSAFGNFLLPIMLGAKDVAFPRLNLASVYIYLAGAVLTVGGMLWSGADTGWTFYTPYSTVSPLAVTPILLGVFIIGFSTIISGLNFIVTTHTLRAPGLHWSRLPLFVWAIYGTSIIQVVATPVLGMVLLLVALERVLGVGIFDPSRGGDPVLYQHMFWFYSHPAVYIMVLPAMGVITETVCAFSRKNIFGYTMIVISTFGIAFVGFFSWGHHMFVSGQSMFGSGIFGVLSMLVAIFTAIKIFNWVATMYQGSIALKTPLLYVLGFIFLLMFGGMTGVAVATTSLDVHWHDTYFIVAHFHYIMVGAVLMAFLAALHYWWPKLFGRLYPERWSFLSAATIIFGFIVTFLPQFLLGNLGMPRRYYQYPEEMQWLNVLSTAGASLLAIGFSLTGAYLLWSLRYGAESPANPWGSRGYEWHSGSPPAPHNFTQVPVFERDVHDYTVPEVPRVY